VEGEGNAHWESSQLLSDDYEDMETAKMRMQGVSQRAEQQKGKRQQLLL